MVLARITSSNLLRKRSAVRPLFPFLLIIFGVLLLPMTWSFTGSTPNVILSTRMTPTSSSKRRSILSRHHLSSSGFSLCVSASSTSSSDVILYDLPSLALSSEIDSWVQPVTFILDPTLNFLAFAMLCRVIISWYPSQNINEFPLNVVSWPTEPLLKTLRPIIPPAFGVDITPIVWFGVFTFLHEILLGQQGLFTMKMKYWS